MRTLAIVLAGGTGKRMGSSTSKQFLLLDNRPIIVHTLQVFQECRSVDGIYLVVNQKDLPTIQEEILETYHFSKIVKLVVGGRLRQDSVRNGLEAIDESCDVVIVHDAARPFVSPCLRGESRSPSWRCSTPLSLPFPARDTIKVISKKGFVLKTLERDSLWHIQTPQTFKYDLITKAYREGMAKEALRLRRLDLHRVPGQEGQGGRRLPLQHQDNDAGRSCHCERHPRAVQGKCMRVGLGYDAHALVEGRALFPRRPAHTSSRGVSSATPTETSCSMRSATRYWARRVRT